MRILGQFIVIMMISLMIQSCASSRMAEELQSGKISFEDGNFKSAFHKLLPLASDGNASAEYAIGYMYYYGYGTHQDTESGLFWMRKSAEQQYQPAIKALQIISQNKVSEEPTQQLTAAQPVKIDSNQILRALTENAEKQTSFSSTNQNLANSQSALNKTAESDSVFNNENLPSENPSPLNGETIVKHSELNTIENTTKTSTQMLPSKNSTADFNLEHSKKYTLQLLGSYNLADIKRMQNRLHLERSSYCAHTERNGRDWYILAYGNFPASYLAQLAVDDLPSNLREMKPWVRNANNLKILA